MNKGLTLPASGLVLSLGRALVHFTKNSECHRCFEFHYQKSNWSPDSLKIRLFSTFLLLKTLHVYATAVICGQLLAMVSLCSIEL